ncbi:hypothetical protein DRN98_10575 [Methanosarcinales archaeon]|nr:MAG: hypothetical protein DRN98_10575 [Methanosarcinales archaeon]
MPKHHPKHYYLNDTVYFITSHVYKKNQYLNAESSKKILYQILCQTLKEFNYKLYAWVILDDHFHFEFKTRIGDDLIKVMKRIHGKCSYQLNNMEQKPKRKVFQNYWDYCIRNKKDFYTHFNYIHHNPVKHGYVKNIDDYLFSSYRYWHSKKGNEWIRSSFREFPIIDFTLKEDRDFPKRK